MLIQLNYRDARPIYEQIKAALREQITAGHLSAGAKLPSVRELAASLVINPNTIQRAYRELESEGYICSVPGRGSFVCAENDAALAHRRALAEEFGRMVHTMRASGFSEEELLALIHEKGESST